MKGKLTYLIAFVSLISVFSKCNNTTKVEEKNTMEKESKASFKTLKDKGLEKKCEQTVAEFYKLYLEKYYNKISLVPDYINPKDSVYIFNEEQLKKVLQSIPSLSNSFIKAEMKKLALCNKQLELEKWEYEPEPEFNIEACNYLWSDPWVGGQGETITDFKIYEILESEDNVLVKVQILAENIEHVKSEVLLSKGKTESPQIENISLKW